MTATLRKHAENLGRLCSDTCPLKSGTGTAIKPKEMNKVAVESQPAVSLQISYSVGTSENWRSNRTNDMAVTRIK